MFFALVADPRIRLPMNVVFASRPVNRHTEKFADFRNRRVGIGENDAFFHAGNHRRQFKDLSGGRVSLAFWVSFGHFLGGEVSHRPLQEPVRSSNSIPLNKTGG